MSFAHYACSRTLTLWLRDRSNQKPKDYVAFLNLCVVCFIQLCRRRRVRSTRSVDFEAHVIWTAKISPRAFDQKNLTRKWFLGLLWPPNNVNSYVLTPPCSVACPGRELVSPSSWQQAAVNLIWGRYGSSVALTTVNQTEHILVVLISPLPAYFRQTCPCQGWEWGHGWRRWSSLNLSPV